MLVAIFVLKAALFRIPFTGNVTKINDNSRNELRIVKFKGSGRGPSDQIFGNSGSKSSSTERFENYSLDVVFVFLQDTWKFWKFLVPFVICTRYESALVPLVENFTSTKPLR